MEAVLETQLLTCGVDEQYQKQLLSMIKKVDGSSAIANIPSTFCVLAGGDPIQGKLASTSWNLLRIAGRILDDVEDGDLSVADREGAITLNSSTGLIVTSSQILLTMNSLDIASKLEIQSCTNQYLLQLTSGQHLDLYLENPSMKQAMAITKAKTGRLVELGCWLGTRIATDNICYLNAAKQYGVSIGIMSQLRDDLSDLWSGDHKSNDIDSRRFGSIPLTFALSNAPDEKRSAIIQGQLNTEEIREFVINSGAPLYLAVQTQLHHTSAINALSHFHTIQSAQHSVEQLAEIADNLLISTKFNH